MRRPGEMKMPENFRYKAAFLAGRPRHGRFDEFSSRHPVMEPGRRAKIFAPFDALAGFSEAIAEETQKSSRDRSVTFVPLPELP